MGAWSGFSRELRQAARGLVQAPAFSLIAIMTLALGIGATTAIFSEVDAVLLRPLPFPHPEQLVSVRERDAQFPSKSVSFPDYLDWQKDNRSFSALGIFRTNTAVLTHAGPPAVIFGQDVSAAYFQALGVRPERGRWLEPSDDRPGAPDTVVISDSLWHERFGGNPRILGTVLELDARPRTIVGVMPPGFPGLEAAKSASQYWISLGATLPRAPFLMNRGSHPGLNGLGRMKPGITLAAARADMDRIARLLAASYPKSNTGEGAMVVTYLDRLVGSSSAALWMVLAAVGLVLLIACANVANLLLARAASQQKVVAIRGALGATRGRLVRERLAECLCLAAAGSALGLALAWLAMRAGAAWMPATLHRGDQLALDLRVLGFTLALTLGTTLLFGLAPAWHASRPDLAEVLKQGGRESAAGGAGGRLRATLVALETALALVLLIGAGLLIRSLVLLQQVNPGFDPHGVLTFSLSLPGARYPKTDQQLEFMHQAGLRLAALPGVSVEGGINPLPFSNNDWENSFTVVGRPAPPPGQEPDTNYAQVQGDYFHAMGMRLLRGRGFDERDTPTSTPVAIVDASFARKYWPGADPLAAALGQQIRPDGKTRTIVGIVARVMDYGLDPAAGAAAGGADQLVETFVPLTQGSDTSDIYFTLRTRQDDPLALRHSAEAAIQSLDPDMPLFEVMTMDQRLAQSLDNRRLTLGLMAAFAALALLLAGIGLYGVIGYAVGQRAHEIGVRMALGADRGRVVGMVLGQGLRLAGVGALAGLAAAWLLARAGSSFLYGVTPHDPLTFSVVPVVLLVIAIAACLAPARRATRVDPVIALRGE